MPAASPTVELIEAVARGDQRALRALYDHESRRLFAIALRITGRRDHAADALQEAFIQVWRNAARFTAERGSVEAWLTGIVRFRALDIRRRLSPEAAEVEADAHTIPAASVEEGLTHDELRRCLAGLDTAQRDAIVLAFVEGFTHAEIADRIAAPLGTVKSWVRRGLLALRSCLGP